MALYLPKRGDANIATFITDFAPGRTNLCLQSNNLSTTWTNNDTTDVQNVAGEVAPDGTATVNSINEDGTANNTHLMEQPSISVTSGTVYTFSAHLKASNRTWGTLKLGTGFAGNTHRYFNLAAGVVGGLGGGADAGSMKDVGNGWYRCRVTATATSTTSTSLIIYAAEGNNDVTYSGLSQESLLFWGAQLETGTEASAYIATTTTSVTQTRTTGDINNDFRQACGEASGLTDSRINSMSVGDVWKHYLENVESETFIGLHSNHYSTNDGTYLT